MWRGLILTKALEQFLIDVRWGDLDYLLIDMPPGHRRHPDGARPPAPADRDARRDHARAGGAEGRGARRRHGAAFVPEGARRRREHERVRRARRVESYAIFGEGGGERLAARHRRAARGRRCRSSPRSRAAATPAARSCSPARRPRRAAAFHDLASRSSTELLPPVEMAGCTARIFELAAANLAATDQSRRSG